MDFSLVGWLSVKASSMTRLSLSVLISVGFAVVGFAVGSGVVVVMVFCVCGWKGESCDRNSSPVVSMTSVLPNPGRYSATLLNLLSKETVTVCAL